MSNQRCLLHSLLAASLLLPAAGLAAAQAGANHGTVQNIEDMKFGPVPGIPACSTGTVLNGNPANGPAILLAKADAGCTVPWHWHTPNEHLMMVKGVARLEMKDAKAITLRAGGYAMMPSKHVHQFHCSSTCVFYVHSDGAFDTHYVSKQGDEIPMEDALKSKPAAPKAKK